MIKFYPVQLYRTKFQLCPLLVLLRQQVCLRYNINIQITFLFDLTLYLWQRCILFLGHSAADHALVIHVPTAGLSISVIYL